MWVGGGRGYTYFKMRQIHNNAACTTVDKYIHTYEWEFEEQYQRSESKRDKTKVNQWHVVRIEVSGLDKRGGLWRDPRGKMGSRSYLDRWQSLGCVRRAIDEWVDFTYRRICFYNGEGVVKYVRKWSCILIISVPLFVLWWWNLWGDNLTWYFFFKAYIRKCI